MSRIFLFALLGAAACAGKNGPRPVPDERAPPAEIAAPATTETSIPPERPAAEEAPRGKVSAAGLDDEMSQLLARHNTVRAKHCAPPLAWSAQLAEVATTWARALAHKGCAFAHSSTQYGENLAAGTARVLDPARVVAMWADEVEQYDFARPRFSGATGHFTQVVWKSTTSVGCGKATCSSGVAIWVCNYDPPGNVMDGFRANVFPAKC